MKPSAAPGLLAALDRLPDLEAVAAALVADCEDGLVMVAGPHGLRQLAARGSCGAELSELARRVWRDQAEGPLNGYSFRIVRDSGAPVLLVALRASEPEIELAAAVLAAAWRLANRAPDSTDSLILKRLLGAAGGELAKVGLDEQRLHELFDKAVDAIFINDGIGFILTNARFRDLVGRQADELAGLGVAELFGETACRREAGGFESCEVEFRRVGAVAWFRIDSLAVWLDGSLVQGGIVRDVTARHQVRQLRSRFVQVASHELRSPLTVIRGYARMLLKNAGDNLAPDQREMLAEIGSQAERLTDFCNRLLDFSASTDGQLCLERAPVRLDELAAGLVERQRIRAAERGVDIRLEQPPAKLPPANLDALRIEQALTNLIDNAIKFSPAGGLVRVVLGHVDGPEGGAGLLVTEVRDEGPGVGTLEAARLFDEFYVGAGGHDRGGFGLGLAITREIILAHGGGIRVEPGSQGGHFIITMPLNAPGD